MSSQYEPKRHTYKMSYRYDYYAVDDTFTSGKGETSSASYPFPIIQFKSRAKAERVQDALNQAFNAGYNWAREGARQELKCEGYTNYETSSVALWLHNDRALLEYVLNRAKANGADHPSEQGLAAFTVWLQNWVEDKGPDTESPFTEFINQAIAMVDWYELAEELYKQAGEK